jgi:hypothetical protein
MNTKVEESPKPIPIETKIKNISDDVDLQKLTHLINSELEIDDCIDLQPSGTFPNNPQFNITNEQRPPIEHIQQHPTLRQNTIKNTLTLSK